MKKNVVKWCEKEYLKIIQKDLHENIFKTEVVLLKINQVCDIERLQQVILCVAPKCLLLGFCSKILLLCTIHAHAS